MGFPSGLVVNNLPECRRHQRHRFDPGWEDPLETETATHSNILAWEIPRTEAPGGQQSKGLKTVRPSDRTHTYVYIIIYIILSV